MLKTLNGKARSRKAPGSTVILSTFLLHQLDVKCFVNCDGLWLSMDLTCLFIGNEMALKMGKKSNVYLMIFLGLCVTER